MHALAEMWRRYGQAAVLAVVVVMAVAALGRLIPSLRWLLFDVDGGQDLLWYRELTRDWFAGVSVYHRHGVTHPPALFLIFWPIYGWLSVAGTKWLYAATSLLATAGLVALLVREARPATRAEGAFLALLVVAGYPIANTIANGQVTLYVLAALVGAFVVLLRMEPGLRRDALAGLLLLIALTKPNLSAAFLCVALFATGGARAVALAIAGYLAATALAAELHGVGPLEAIRAWLGPMQQQPEDTGYGDLARDPTSLGYGNLLAWMATMGQIRWAMPVTAVTLAAHAAWTYANRAANPWALFGVAAVVARISSYHRPYDDLLLVLPIVALYRIARNAEARRGERAAAGLLVVLGSLCLAWGTLIASIEPLLVAIWLLEAAFLGWWAARTSRGSGT